MPSYQVLIPAYNAEKWIKETIRSASEQTWPNKEIIIVDDGSIDNTLGIAKKYESQSVKVITQENKGASAARNKALSLAQGDYIQWLDADDLLAPDKISQQMRFGDKGNNSRLLLSSAWGRFYFSAQKAKFTHHMLWQDLVPAEWLYKNLYHNVWMSIESWLVSRKLTDLIGPWDEELSIDDDGEYFSRIVAASEMINFIQEAKSYCRTGNIGSISSEINLSDRKKESLFKSVCLQIDHMRSLEDSERTRDACLRFLQRWLIYFYPDRCDILEKANSVAKDLGGELHAPVLAWTYDMIKQLFGWKMAKKTQVAVRQTKVLVKKNWNRLLCC